MKKVITPALVAEKTVITLPLAIFALMCLLPFVVLVSASLSSMDALKQSVPILPVDFTLEAYKLLFFKMGDILQSYLISFAVTGIGTMLNLVLCALFAYPLADVKFRYRSIASFLLFFSMIFNAGIIPTFIMIRRVFNLYNTYAILVLFPLLAPAHIFFLRIFMQGIPVSLHESARIDGANEYRILFTIDVPLLKAGIAALAFQIILMYWNDAYTSMWFAPSKIPVARYIMLWESYLLFLRDVQAGLIPGMDFSGGDIPDVTVRYAMSVISTLPMVVIFLMVQKYFVGGVTTGAVKE